AWSTRCQAVCGSSAIELAQETQIAFKEQAQVVHAVAKHGKALQAGAEGEAYVTLGIETKVAYHLGMDLPGTRDLQPPPVVRAGGEHHVDFGRRFGKREKGRAETNGEVVGFEE